MAAGTYAITGIQKCLGPGGETPIRREIDEWWFAKDKNTLYQQSLFIYALNEFQAMNPHEQQSYFQVAGIHGQPLQSWDTNDPETDWYCVHASTLFPPWHRPYLMLYEQRIYEIMKKLIPTTFAETYHAAMHAAADSWRLPFWDSAKKRPDWKAPNDTSKLGPNVPFLLTVSKVQVMGKLSDTVEVKNPMWRFVVPSMNTGKTTFGDYGVKEVKTPEGTLPYQLAKATSRWPQSPKPDHVTFTTEWVNGDKQNWESATTELRKSTAVESNTLPEAVYRLFIERYIPDWEQFSSTGYKSNQHPTAFTSLEGFHNAIHWLAGGLGHMGDVGVASFDPVFFVHHCNVDRLFAIWQELYPNKYVVPWKDPIRGQIDINTTLAPFNKNTNATKFTSADVRDTKKLGYAYPETQRWLPQYKTNGVFDHVKYEAAIRTTIEQLYSTTGKSITLLPGMEDVAKKLMTNCSSESLKTENFPPGLVKLKQSLLDVAVGVASESVGTAVDVVGDIGGALFGGGMGQKPKQPAAPSTGGKSKGEVKDFSWESQDYVVNILYDRFALGGHPFAVRVYLGNVKLPSVTSVIQPLTNTDLCAENNPGLIGVIYNFSSPVESRGTGPEGCTTCRAQLNSTTKTYGGGQIVLTDFLVEFIRKQMKGIGGVCLDDLGPAGVTKWLKGNLHWRVVDQHNNLIKKEDLGELKVSVAVGKAKHCFDAKVPSIYSDYKVLYDITDGRLGGACTGDL